ncbi:MAG: molecular chaperone TorD family protein, partial [Planctomycetes bacterium]|nr:molecular chaperone TorD family protein [Planctomycetota bacterium]
LEFMYFLVFKEVEAIRSSDPESARGYLEKQKEFLVDHLGAWVPEFAGNMEKNAKTEFYKNVSRATRSFIKKDMTELAKKFIDFSEVLK